MLTLNILQVFREPFHTGLLINPIGRNFNVEIRTINIPILTILINNSDSDIYLSTFITNLFP